ncbi:MAG: SpoIIE family protein phosphatase [Planctomycetota bacterium]|jgi:sigma-B regulation protein RsbU (phosphoserine phosphatase)
MKIQTKLLLLLLAVGVVPMLAIVLLTRLSIRNMSTQIAAQIETQIQDNSIRRLQTDAHNFKEVIQTAAASARLALEMQGQQVEQLLAQPADENFIYSSEMPFGSDMNPDKELVNLANLQSVFYPEEIDFFCQGVFLTKNVTPQMVHDDLSRLQKMTGTYEHLYQSNRGRTLWHYTTLENGLHTNYPGGGSLPSADVYDPRTRPWYSEAKNKPGDIIANVTKDASTGKIILTFSKAIHRPDGRFAGVTAIDKTIEDIFKGFKLPRNFKKESYLIIAGFGNPGQTNPVESSKLKLWLANKTETDTISWKHEPDFPELTSTDSPVYQAMLADTRAGRPGHQIMEFEGEQCIWIYSDHLGISKVILFIIVPYDTVLSMTSETQQTILGESTRQLQLGGFLILTIIALAIILSYIRARKFTTPINQLASVADKLADGDFGAQAQIKTGDEIQRLAEVFNEIGPKLDEHQKTQRSLALARAIQQNLLPKSAPKLSNFDIAGKCRYCDETGGDYFDFIPLKHDNTESLGIVLGDVTGHGVGAALLMASGRSILRNASNHFNGNLADLMTEFNNQLSEDTGDDKFMTLFYGALCDQTRQLTWASGGHDPAIWYQHKEASFEELPNTGPLTGFMKDLPFTQAGPVTLESGDILLVGTDGIWEAENTEGVPYGKDRLHDMIARNAEYTADQIATTIIESVEAFTAPQPPADDITLIIIKA